MELFRGVIRGDGLALGLAVAAVVVATLSWFLVRRRRPTRRDL